MIEDRRWYVKYINQYIVTFSICVVDVAVVRGAV